MASQHTIVDHFIGDILSLDEIQHRTNAALFIFTFERMTLKINVTRSTSANQWQRSRDQKKTTQWKRKEKIRWHHFMHWLIWFIRFNYQIVLKIRMRVTDRREFGDNYWRLSIRIGTHQNITPVSGGYLDSY